MRHLIRKSSLFAVAALAFGLLSAGCDDHVTVIRDPDIPVFKHATWAWRPQGKPAEIRRDRSERNDRPVISRDVITRGETISRATDQDTDIARQQFRIAIEQTLASKGLTEVSDPQVADFLVDYHVAVRQHNATVEHVYPGGYPGVVCGPFGCWESWGWGPPEVSYEHIRFREGTVVFDLVKHTNNRLAYRAIGQKPVHRNTFSQDEVSDFVHHLLKDLKTKG